MADEEQGEGGEIYEGMAGEAEVQEMRVPFCLRCTVNPPRTKNSLYCDDCQRGSCPAAVEATVSRAVRLGILAPVRTQKCMDCGAQARQYDHRDYNLPLTVAPVCHRCNQARGPAVKYDWDRDVLGIEKMREEHARKKAARFALDIALAKP